MKRPQFLLLLLAAGGVAHAQQGAKNGEWHFYGGDAGTTKYSALDQINAANVKDLKIVWEWKAQNFGKRPDFNWEVTPLMAGGVLYVTAGTRRDAVAIDAATGETLWMYRIDEGARGALVARPQNRGLAYWSDGKGDERILLISPGYQLIALSAKTGVPIPSFGKNGIVDLTEGLDREVVKPGQIGSSSPAIVINETVVVGAALGAGTAPVSKSNVPGYVRGFDVRTGKRLWTFHTIAQPGEFGHETWENDSWKYSGNTGAWVPLTGDEELGYVYIPVEMPTGDFYGGHRPGNSLFSDSVVCLDARTGRRIWHYQLVHHDIWDMDVSAPPMIIDINVNGKKIKAVAVVSKQAFTYVFDRVTGQPVWPIVERPVPQSDVPGEKTSPTQPFPTKPAAYDRQGVTLDDLIDFTPALKAEAVEIASQYKLGPLFTPPIVVDSNGRKGIMLLPSHVGGSNWQGGAVDPETGMLYVSSVTNIDTLALAVSDPKRSDMAYIGAGRPGQPRPPGGVIVTVGTGADAIEQNTARVAPKTNLGPQGLPLVKPPWGRITAIDLNTGEHVWMTPNGEAPDYIKEHPAMKGIDLSHAGRPSRSPLIVTKTLLFGADGSNLFNSVAGGGGNTFRAYDKKTGKVVSEMQLPASATGIPMTYMVDGRQFIVVAVGAIGVPASLVALALP
ncbi:MAG: pyrroloquinoline quinone-dependent dehydrogenase [Acidobacteriota bacterium]|nr:pyrroloquinoline quinone-dependent dehydrogenase [Acidobacteriota bacterium]